MLGFLVIPVRGRGVDAGALVDDVVLREPVIVMLPLITDGFGQVGLGTGRHVVQTTDDFISSQHFGMVTHTVFIADCFKFSCCAVLIGSYDFNS